MNVLAFDTCFDAVSAAVLGGAGGKDSILAQRFEAGSDGQAERLLPMIAEAMDEAGLAFGDLDRIAVTVGPGSFTGVRIGVAAARALAMAAARPVVGMSSLEVMADEARSRLGGTLAGRPLAVAVDARRGMVFLQLFAGGKGGQRASAPSLLDPAGAARLVGPGPAVVVGSAAVAVAGEIAAGGGHAEAALADLQPHARSLAVRAGGLAPAGPLRPLYLRRPDAKLPDDASLPRVVS